jgi:hypothetical protein
MTIFYKAPALDKSIVYAIRLACVFKRRAGRHETG